MALAPAAADPTTDLAEFPSLPFEMVVLVLECLPARSIGAVGMSLCHEWAAAARSENVWATVVRRRWPNATLDHFGARFSGWRHLFDSLLAVRPPRELSEADRHLLQDGALIELYALGAAARRFVQGVAQSGFVSRSHRTSLPSLPSATCSETLLTRGPTCALAASDGRWHLHIPRGGCHAHPLRMPRPFTCMWGICCRPATRSII